MHPRGVRRIVGRSANAAAPHVVTESLGRLPVLPCARHLLRRGRRERERERERDGSAGRENGISYATDTVPRPSWSRFGAVLGPPWAVLGPFGWHLGAFGGHLICEKTKPFEIELVKRSFGPKFADGLRETLVFESRSFSKA